MNYISEQTINQAIDKLHTTAQDQITDLFKDIGNKQPALLGFLLDYCDELENEELRNELIYMFAVIIISFGIHGVTPEVSDQEIEAEQQNQMAGLAMLEGKTDDELDTIVNAITLSQPVLFDFIKEQLLGHAAESGVQDEQRMATTFSVLKLVVDVMTSVQNRFLAGSN